MIEFEGQLSEECEEFVVKKMHCKARITCIFLNIFFCSVTILLGFALDLMIIAVFAIVFFLVFLIFIIFPNIVMNKEKDIKPNLPNIVIIENNKISIEGKGPYSYTLKDITDIRKIVDLGEFYYFYFPHNYFFICQKNLIKTGSIEEFEELFNEIIERKI